MVVTEVAIFPLVAGSDISNKNSNAGGVWQGIIDTVSRQDGFKQSYYGHQVESPDVAQLFVEWDKIESHQSFMKSIEYPAMLESLKKLLGGAPSIVHYEFNPANKLTSSLSAPVTECVTFHMPSKSSNFESNYEKFAEVLGSASGCLGAVGGWSVEDVEHEKLESGTKGKAFLFAIGWQSVDAHMAFRDTDVFKANIGKLRGEPQSVEMHHVAIKSA